MCPCIEFAGQSGVGTRLGGRKEAPENKHLLLQREQSFWCVPCQGTLRMRTWIEE